MAQQGNSLTGYDATVAALLHTQRGSFANPSYHPAFRASGLFIVDIGSDTDTVVSFLNYWTIKNGINAVAMLATLRDEAGTIVARSYFRIDRSVYAVSARTMLQEVGREGAFIGSLELEIYSAEDLKFAFPAFMVFQISPEGISAVHTNQRCFNDPEDRRRGSRFNHWQTGFDVASSRAIRPVLWTVNGSEAVGDTTAKVAIFNADGRRREWDVALGELPPYASRRIVLDELPGAADHLDGGTGFAKIDLELGNVYNRFMVGHESRDGSWRSVTHSYFDCTHDDDAYPVTQFDENTRPCFVPVNLIESLEVSVIFYPIMVPAHLAFDLEVFNHDGKIIATVPLNQDFDAAGDRVYRADIRATLRAAGLNGAGDFVSIRVRSLTGRFPTRMTFGLNYWQDADIPGTNISSSVLMATSHGTKHRSWLWGPCYCRSDIRNYILVSHLSARLDDGQIAETMLEIHAPDGILGTLSKDLPNGTGWSVCLEDWLREQGHTAEDGAVLWYVVKSSNPSLIANQLHVSKAGRVGGDHSF